MALRCGTNIVMLLAVGHPPPPARVRTPSPAKTAAAVIRIALTGSLSAILAPMTTAGMFASIMPRVVPRTTG